MGKKPTDSGLGSALFSRVRLRVLGILFGNPERQFSSSEIIELAASGSGAVQRELARLSAADLVSVTASGNRKLYQANRRAPLYRELRGIVRTVAVMEPLRLALQVFARKISLAFVYGSVASGKDRAASDIDV